MWVAHECLSTCGETRSSSLTFLAAVLTTCHTAWRDIFFPLVEMNTASASVRRAQRAGAMAGLPRGPSQAVSAQERVPADGDEALLGALAVGDREGPFHVEVAEAKSGQLRDAHPGRVQGLEDRPVAKGSRVVADHGRQAGARPRLL